MAKTKISEFSATPGNNTDIDGINIAEGCAPSGINDAIRELMSQLKDFQAGTAGDSFNGPVGTTTAAAGAFTTLSASGAVTLSGGTANSIPYLNGSKVLTTGSALTFDGSSFGVGTSTPSQRIDAQIATTTEGSGLAVTNSQAGGYGSGLSFYSYRTDGTTKVMAGQVSMLGAASWADSANSTSSMLFKTINAGTLSEQMRLTSTGLGIGTSSPDGVLTIPATNSNTPRFRFQHPTNDADASIDTYQDGGGTYLSIGTNSYQTNAGALSKFDATKAAGLAYFDNSGAILFYNATSGGSITEKMRLDTSGNLGLGVTPSADWASSGYKAAVVRSAFLAGGTGAGLAVLGNNAYNDGAGWKYVATGNASSYVQNASAHAWNIAASGTAGNAITFTQAMTLDASGNLGVGTTSPANRVQSRRDATTDASNSQFISENRTGAAGQYAIYGSRFDNGSGSGFTPVAFGAVQTAAAGRTGAFIIAVSDTDNVNLSTHERARINSGGNLLVGATAVPSASVAGFCATGTSSGNITSSGSSTSAYNHWVFYNGNGLVGYISTSGSTTTYSTSSDHRLKENIQPMTGALAKVAQLKPRTYNWKADGSAGEGFIAHELAEVVPQCVTGEKDAVDADGKPVYQGIDTSFLVATLTAAIQEQQAIIETLTARVAALESK